MSIHFQAATCLKYIIMYSLLKMQLARPIAMVTAILVANINALTQEQIPIMSIFFQAMTFILFPKDVQNVYHFSSTT